MFADVLSVEIIHEKRSFANKSEQYLDYLMFLLVWTVGHVGSIFYKLHVKKDLQRLLWFWTKYD